MTLASEPILNRDGQPARIAIVHDFLAERGGAERVAIELLEALPESPIYTTVYWPGHTYDEFRHADVRPILGAGFAKPGSKHRRLLPYAITGLTGMRLDYDLVISSSSGLAHLATNRTGKQLVYCHTPARWLYRPDQYFRGLDPKLRRVVAAAAPAYRRLDRKRMCGADRVIVNARVIRNEVDHAYGIRPEVIHPVSALDPSGPETAVDVPSSFYLTTSRLLGYKRVDLINEVARKLPHDQFVVVGDGPERSRLEADAPPNVRFLGVCSDSELRWLYRNAERVLLTCAEDYGLVPAEAASFGTVSVVPNARGFRDIDGGHESTVRYAFGDTESLIAGIRATYTGASQPLDLALLQNQFRKEVRSIATGLIQGDPR